LDCIYILQFADVAFNEEMDVERRVLPAKSNLAPILALISVLILGQSDAMSWLYRVLFFGASCPMRLHGVRNEGWREVRTLLRSMLDAEQRASMDSNH
jgi:hypothetical protein